MHAVCSSAVFTFHRQKMEEYLEKNANKTVQHDLNVLFLTAKANKAFLSLRLLLCLLTYPSVKSKGSQCNSSGSGTLALH